MQNLFLVDGASGVGKSDLIKWVMDNNAYNVGYLRKATTRKERDYEKDDPNILLDLDFVNDDEFNDREFDYIYTYGGSRYGFSARTLTNELMKYDNVIAIIRNNQLIQRIANDYSIINVVPTFIYTDRSELIDRLEKQHLSEAMIRFRLERSELALREYYAHPEVYREILINNSDKNVFHATVDRVMAKYENAPKVNPHLISVMMSFNPSNKKLDDYYEAMEEAVAQISTSLRCRRVDSAPGSPKIAGEFRSLAAASRCLIVDLTENRQNVYYELGYIHASGKPCLVTAEEGTNISFYPREYKVLFYGSAGELRRNLERELRGVLSDFPGL
jgi:guanylate kinase